MSDVRGQELRRWGVVALAIAAVVLLSSCVAGPNPEVAARQPAGFLRGIWHGLIFPVTFFISLFTDDVSVYEVANRGNWYDFGFFLGIMVLGGGSHGARRRGR